MHTHYISSRSVMKLFRITLSFVLLFSIPGILSAQSVTDTSKILSTSRVSVSPMAVAALPGVPEIQSGKRCGPGNVTLAAGPGAGGYTIRWYATLTGGTFFYQGISYVTPVLINTTTYYVTTYNDQTGETPVRTPIYAQIYPVPYGTVSVTGQSRFGSGALTLTASGAPSGNSYKWYNASNVVIGTGAVYTTPSFSESALNYVYVKETNSGGCESSNPVWVSVNVYPLPVITGDSNPPMGMNSLLQCNSGFDKYEWFSASDLNTVLKTSFSDFTFDARPGRYVVRVTEGGITAMSDVFTVNSYEDQDINYVITNTVQNRGITSVDAVMGLTVQSNTQSIQYYDGLGRLVQGVITQGSPSHHDIVQPTVYDAYGREHRKYLPVAPNTNNGWYKPGIIAADGSYADVASGLYSNGDGDMIADDAKPYAEALFEVSPLSRVVTQGAFGTAWQPTMGSYSSPLPTDRSVRKAYQASAAGEVLQWTYTAPTASAPFGTISAGTADAPLYYAAAKLTRNRTKNEQHKETIEYTDKEGRVVLRRIQTGVGTISTTDADRDVNYASTYYIYDAFGNVACVIPPEATSRLATEYYQAGATDATQDAFLKRWAFRYAYDGRHHMIMKQVPGADIHYMVYDGRDRLVMTQSGNQRAAKQWVFVKFDAFNRTVLTGIYTADVVLAQTEMQQRVDDFYAQLSSSSSAWFETYTGSGTIHGYDNKSFPQEANPLNYLSVIYYDSYAFKATWPDDYRYASDALAQESGGQSYTQQESGTTIPVGQVTGTKVKILDGGVVGGYTWLKSVNYYDDKYRIIQVITDNYKGGVDRTSNLYDFTGKVLKSQTTHQQTDVARWKDLVNVTIIGNKINRTSGNGWGSSGLASTEFLPANTDGWIQFTATEENSARVIGLSTANADANYPSIGYALFLQYDKTLAVYENGVSKGLIANGYKTGDIFRIQRTGTQIRYFRNGIDVTPPNATTTASLMPLYIDIALGNPTSSIVDVRSSFTSDSRVITKRFVYDHAGRIMNEYHKLDDQPEVELIGNEYNELGQLVDKKLHSISGSPYKQSIDYRYNIRGWLTRINDSELGDGENDYFGMNLAYNEEQGTGNSEFTIGTEDQVGAYSFTGNVNDSSPLDLDGSVNGAVLTTDNQGNVGQAYAFDGNGYIEIPNSKTAHAFIQNTGKFTITAFLKLSDLSARSVILSNTGTSLYKGFLFMYETYGGTAGDHQLRMTLLNGQSGVSTVSLGARNTIHDNNWHHVAVVGDGSYVRFYVDGILDGTPSPITLQSDGDASYTTLIGKSRVANGAVFLGLNGALDELTIFDRPLTLKEIQALAQRAQAGVKQTIGGLYNGNISGAKWSVNQGLGDIKQMAYTFDYDAMNRLVQANHLQSSSVGAGQQWQQGKFDEGGLQYDLNGNIRNLMRYGDMGIQDNLTYSYGAVGATGNQLLKVADASNKFTGFVDGPNTTNDYGYDLNGNMVMDLNKGISSAGITYNYLNLPELVTRGVGTVRYIYDGTGRKVAQIATSGTISKRTDYVGDFLYEDDVLQSINHEEGRIVVAKPELIYSFDGSVTDPIAAVDVTITPFTANGNQTYILARATTANSRSGMFPIGGAFPVHEGERYKIRARGYRDKGSISTNCTAYILAQANGVDLAWTGAALQSSSANEAWVEQTVTMPPGATQLEAGVAWGTVAAGNTIYLNDFEITRLSSSEPEYQYTIKDHLGNVRVTFTTKDETEASVATLEDQSAAREEGDFANYDDAVRVYSDFFDHTHDASVATENRSAGVGTTGYAALLRGGANERYGLSKSLSVMPGDTIKMEVYAKYLNPDEQSWSPRMSTFMTSVATGGNALAGRAIDGGVTGSVGGSVFPLAGLISHVDEEDDGPKAYLNWVIFDRDYNQKDAGFVKLSDAAAESGQNVAHERLAQELVVKQPGYVYVYLSNESETPMDVYFDDFSVEQVKGAVIQSQDYYPFGVTFNDYRREDNLGSSYLYNGKELQDELELDWLDYGARMYMPEIGRFLTNDVLAEKYVFQSPLAYAANNPIKYIDIYGLGPGDPIDKLNKLAKAINEQSNKAWSNSFTMKGDRIKKVDEKGFIMTSNEAGEIKTKNEVDGGSSGIKFDYTHDSNEKLEGDDHTHPYKDGTEGVAFSPEDIASLSKPLKAGAGAGFTRVVEAGDSRFALVVNDPEKAAEFVDKVPINIIYYQAREKNRDGTFQEQTVNSVKAVVGDGTRSGIDFYRTINKDKDEFVKVN